MPSQHVSYPYLKRLISFLVDWYLSTLFSMIPTVVFQSINGRDLVIVNRIDNLSVLQAIVATVLSVLVYILYFCAFPLRKNGQTPGRRLMKLRLSQAGGASLTFSALLMREFVGVFLLQGSTTTTSINLLSLLQILTGINVSVPYQAVSAGILLCSLVLLFTKREQTLPDLMSKTKIVSVQ
jgi:uncharacterized RDD family membrane protein YckC